MKDILLKQIQFEFWANNVLLQKIEEATPLNSRVLELFSHILSVGSMWLNRLKMEAITATLFQERTIAECGKIMLSLEESWINYFKTVSVHNLNKIIEFTSALDNSKRSIAASDAIIHIVHHSSYHRGQMVTLLKGSIEQLPIITYMPFASKEIKI